ncbi:MAG: T9SS type A sorting domain-containing protein [Bacteroidales bacterium]|nr:T9SS type A sorting domain-containing protein [Bacteroidales bacterium]
MIALLLLSGARAQSCLPEGITFTTQAQIDSFQVNYPNCTEIEGDVTIGDNNGLGSDIIDLTGLSNINSISGFLLIGHNYDLPSLNGLEGITSVGGFLWVGYHQKLTNIDGLSNLTTIGGNLYITYNSLLNNLNGLENLTSIAGVIWIWQNSSLTSLSGLDSISAESISDLSINWNFSLSACAVHSICDYLASPNGTVEIHDNETGCDSQQEVEDACFNGVEEALTPKPQISISPNPSNTTITLALPSNAPLDNTILSIYNINAQQVISRRITEPITVLDIGTLPSGVYCTRITTGNTVMASNFIKQ